MRNHLLAAAIVPLLTTACADAVGDKPQATVVSTPVATPARTGAATPATAAKDGPRYAITAEGSSVGFVAAKVTKTHTGGFGRFSGTIVAPSDKPQDATVDVQIDMASVTTDNQKLTEHLKKPDFFDVAQFPTGRFTSTSIAPNPDGTVTVTGDLTLRGVTKRVSFPATVAVAGDTATAKAEFGINRQDFKIAYKGAPDDLVRDDVLLKLDVKAKRG